ncbi:MAG: hypothetical protein AAF388_12940 [Bacteroidota bacterium]
MLVSNNTIPQIIFFLFVLIMLAVMGTFFGWIWAIGNGFQKFIHPHIKMKNKKFRIFYFLGIGYFAFSPLSIVLNDLLVHINLTYLTGFIIPLHLFFMFCLFYSIYYVGKTIKAAEIQQEVRFSDVFGEFMLIWFFPIGIWFIQPRVNAIALKDLSESIIEQIGRSEE